MTDWITTFPGLEPLDGEARRLLTEQSRLVTMPAGAVLFSPGSLCENYMLVLDGQVRVQSVGESGREIVLYRVEPGQSCVMTTSCLMTDAPYSAEGVTESVVQAVILPGGLFHRLLGSSEAFRRFVFAAYSTRLSDLFCLIEEVAFGRIDKRLAAFLLDHSDAQGQLATTHQELAVELGTAREVVSRQLKEFERRGWIKISRGLLVIDQQQGLEGLRG